jgi:DNA ligase D-like protein (predicted 3'-phosphoesterase)
MARFVVQEHFARSHHFDFRLEKDGVFKSWAVPKGVPEQIGISRLAIQVEDHALEFGEFEGTIAEGQYGAGKIIVWDKGDYQLVEWSATLITFNLRGFRVKGSFGLTRFTNAESRKWLLKKLH